MKELKELNLKYIDFLSNTFGIEYTNGNLRFKEGFKGVSSNDLFNTTKFIVTEIWNPNNLDKIFKYFVSTEENFLYYWPSSETVPIDDYLGKAGILNYKSIISDPISYICMINPSYEDSPMKRPELYFEYIVENALFLVSVAEWIENDLLYLVPELFYWDQNAYIQIGNLNNKIRKVNNLEKTIEWEKYSTLFKFEQGSRLAMKSHKQFYGKITYEDAKKYLPELSDDKIKSLVVDIKNTPKHRREPQIIKMLAEEHNIPEHLFAKRLDKWKKHYIFDVENYFGDNLFKESINITKGLTLGSALYVAEHFKSIPVTDDDVNKSLVQLYSRGIKLDSAKKNELEFAQSKISLNAPFFNNISPDFVKKYRDTEYPIKLNKYLEECWNRIRSTKNSSDFNSAVVKLNDYIKTDMIDLKKDIDQIKKESRFVGYKKFLDEFYIGNIEQESWSIAIKNIASLIKGLISWHDYYDSKKYELEKNPLFIFLDKERNLPPPNFFKQIFEKIRSAVPRWTRKT